jgi:hypothetical protein
VATTLLQFWQQQLSIYQAEAQAAQKALTDAQVGLDKAKSKLNGAAGDVTAMAKTTADIAATRAALVSAEPPDAGALVQQLVALIITQRAQQGAVLDDQDAIALQQAAVDAAAAIITRATARVTSVSAKVEALKADDAGRVALKTALGKAPLQTLKADATALDGSQTPVNAKKRIDKNFPAELVTIATKRHDTRSGRLVSLKTDADNAADAIGTQYATDSGLRGKAAQKKIVFDRAQGALAVYVSTAATRFTQSKTALAALEAIELAAPGTVPDVLTAAEQAQVQGGDLKTKGVAAEPKAEDLDTDLNGVFTAQSALSAQLLTSIETDVDSVSADPQIAAKRAAVQTAQKKFSDDLAAFAAKGDLDRWEAAIPDGAWNVLLQYLEAVAAVTDLKTTDPAALATAMDTAENDYAQALGLAEAADRRADFLNDAATFQQSLLTSARSTVAARLPSAVRGDSY